MPKTSRLTAPPRISRASIAKPGLAALNDMITQQAAVVAVIDQFKILMFAMLIVSPLVLFLRKPPLVN